MQWSTRPLVTCVADALLMLETVSRQNFFLLFFPSE